MFIHKTYLYASAIFNISVIFHLLMDILHEVQYAFILATIPSLTYCILNFKIHLFCTINSFAKVKAGSSVSSALQAFLG